MTQSNALGFLSLYIPVFFNVIATAKLSHALQYKLVTFCTIVVSISTMSTHGVGGLGETISQFHGLIVLTTHQP